MWPSPFFAPSTRVSQLGDRTVFFASLAVLGSRLGLNEQAWAALGLTGVVNPGDHAAGLLGAVTVYFVILFVVGYFYEASAFETDETRVARDDLNKPPGQSDPETRKVVHGLTERIGQTQRGAAILGRINQIFMLFLPIIFAGVAMFVSFRSIVSVALTLTSSGNTP